jgi:hypothetical protein
MLGDSPWLGAAMACGRGGTPAVSATFYRSPAMPSSFAAAVLTSLLRVN